MDRLSFETACSTSEKLRFRYIVTRTVAYLSRSCRMVDSWPIERESMCREPFPAQPPSEPGRRRIDENRSRAPDRASQQKWPLAPQVPQVIEEMNDWQVRPLKEGFLLVVANRGQRTLWISVSEPARLQRPHGPPEETTAPKLRKGAEQARPTRSPRVRVGIRLRWWS
jgi:hypothetical protein